jgi:hypothetical protein
MDHGQRSQPSGKKLKQNNDIMTPKFQSFLLTTPHVKGMVKAMKEAQLRIDEDKDAGTIRAFFGTTEVFLAIQKGDKNQPWIVRHFVGLFA